MKIIHFLIDWVDSISRHPIRFIVFYMYKKRTGNYLYCLVLFVALAGQSAYTQAKFSYEEAGYDQPLATLLGTVLNSGWAQSSRVGRGFGIYLGIPVFLAYVSEADQYYTAYRASGCAQSRLMGSSIPCNDPDYLPYKVPTIIGPNSGGRTYKEHILQNGEPSGQYYYTKIASGEEYFQGHTILPFLMPQMSLSFFFTEIKLRYLPVPISSLGVDGQFMGVGIQHDIASIFGRFPVDISLASSFNMWSFTWEPKDLGGSITMDGITSFSGLVIGKRLGIFELFTELGWESSSLKVSGSIWEESSPGHDVNLDVSVKGRNGLRAAFNMAVHFASNPVIGQQIGSQLGSQFNIFTLKKEGAQ